MPVNDEKQSFSKRLKDSLKRAQIVERGAAGIARQFNLRYEGTPVTAQAVRKWLGGKSLPSQDKLRALALWLEVSPQWLRFGEGDGSAGRTLRQEGVAYRVEPGGLAKKFEALNDSHKRMVVELIAALLRLEGKR